MILAPAMLCVFHLSRGNLRLIQVELPGAGESQQGAAHQLQLFGSVFAQTAQCATAVRAAWLCRQQPFFVTGE
ncbi:hypothetical protein EG805_12290 [Escherichia coli]|nr:hypothetical protein [Escherichia coli]EFE8294220.1 hypothetical protein [Escherichia coli]EGE4032913.1 hypothetical protein [Escherichia coli]MBK2440623.1 hypothetical protein [Klebsiella pneumoniae]HCK38375.1 hypothetical protein [Shigella sp.]